MSQLMHSSAEKRVTNLLAQEGRSTLVVLCTFLQSKGVIHRVTRGISLTGRSHRILSTSATALPNTSIINLN